MAIPVIESHQIPTESVTSSAEYVVVYHKRTLSCYSLPSLARVASGKVRPSQSERIKQLEVTNNVLLALSNGLHVLALPQLSPL